MALAATGCSTTVSGLKSRFAREQSCPADQVAVVEQGGTVYRASGCGVATEYVCEGFVGMGDPAQRCHQRGSNPREPSDGPPMKTPTRADLVAPK
ncbi:MAG: hypothetical protein ABI488_18190 [Polyangiaceae bacterium]